MNAARSWDSDSEEEGEEGRATDEESRQTMRRTTENNKEMENEGGHA